MPQTLQKPCPEEESCGRHTGHMLAPSAMVTPRSTLLPAARPNQWLGGMDIVLFTVALVPSLVSFPLFVKMVLAFCMIAGRLELFTLLVLSSFGRR